MNGTGGGAAGALQQASLVFSADGWERGCARGGAFAGGGWGKGKAWRSTCRPFRRAHVPSRALAARSPPLLPLVVLPGIQGPRAPQACRFAPRRPMLEVSCWDHSANACDPTLCCFMAPSAAAEACSLQAVADISTFSLNAVLEAGGFGGEGGAQVPSSGGSVQPRHPESHCGAEWSGWRRQPRVYCVESAGIPGVSQDPPPTTRKRVFDACDVDFREWFCSVPTSGCLESQKRQQEGVEFSYGRGTPVQEERRVR